MISKIKDIFSYIDEKTKNVEKKRVIFTWSNPSVVTSANSVLADILTKINVINPFASLNAKCLSKRWA